MRPKLNKKLALNKATVTHLGHSDMEDVLGGDTGFPVCIKTQDKTCLTINDPGCPPLTQNPTVGIACCY